jgi:hypothetical protein
VPELTPKELAAMLEKVDSVIRTARDLEAQIKRRMVESARRDQPAGNWSTGRRPSERRKTSHK